MVLLWLQAFIFVLDLFVCSGDIVFSSSRYRAQTKAAEKYLHIIQSVQSFLYDLVFFCGFWTKHKNGQVDKIC